MAARPLRPNTPFVSLQNGILTHDSYEFLFRLYNSMPKATAKTTGSVVSGGTVLVTLTWPNPFPDANYVVVASVYDTTASTSSLSVVHIEAKTTSTVSVRVTNTAAVSKTGTVEVIGMVA